MHNKIPRYYYFINKLNKNDIKKLNQNIAVIYRNYNKQINLKKLKDFRDFLKKNKIKFFLANNIKLAIQLNLDGAYIPSFNKSLKHLAYSYKKNFRIIGSAHNLKEIRTKEIQNVRKIFLSSLFKKNKNFLGINKFKFLSRLTKKKVVKDSILLFTLLSI